MPAAYDANITVTLNKDALVYCAAFESEMGRVETADILRAGTKSISSRSASTVILKDLHASTFYFLYCYAAEIKTKTPSTPYNVFTSSFRTACCSDVSFDIPTTVLELKGNGAYSGNFAYI